MSQNVFYVFLNIWAILSVIVAIMYIRLDAENKRLRRGLLYKTDTFIPAKDCWATRDAMVNNVHQILQDHVPVDFEVDKYLVELFVISLISYNREKDDKS